MAQQSAQYPPQSFSHHQIAASPTGSHPGGQPAAKRPRLSPNGQSPYSSPNMANLSLPNQVFSQPFLGSQANGTHSTPHYNTTQQFSPNASFNHSPTFNSLNTPAPPSAHSPPATSINTASSDTMGPPDRPDNRPTDLNELGDVLFGAGVDLREEEAALLRSQANNANNANNENLSFEDQLRQASGFKHPFSRDNFYSQNRPGDRASFYGAGSFNQEPQTEQSAEEIAKAEEKKAIRRQAEIKQYHMNNPFLSGANLERRLRTESQKQHVQLPMRDGDILRANRPNIAPQQITVHGPDNNDVVKIVKGEPLLGLKNSIVEVLTLMSLATEDRLRVFIEDTATLARGRRTGAQGLAPLDMIDLAKRPDGEAAAASLPSLENSVASPKGNPLKRSYSEMNQFSTPTSSQFPSLPPPNPITTALQKLSRADQAAEEARLLKRKKRLEAAEARSAPDSVTVSGDPTSLPASTPGTPGEVDPTVAPLPKKSALKKDAKRAAAPSDAAAFAASNKTLQMALGGGKKLSWMKQSTEPTNPYLANRKTEATKKKDVGTAPSGGIGGVGAFGGVEESKKEGLAVRNWGGFNEGAEEGRGLQLRDVISVLEHDGKQKRALQRAYARLNRAETRRVEGQWI